MDMQGYRQGQGIFEDLESRRYLAFLDPVTPFGSGGFTGAGTGLTGSAPLLEQANGSIIALVKTKDTYGDNLDLIRFTKSGKIDRAFGKSGYVDPGHSTFALFETPDGKLLGTFRFEKRLNGTMSEGFGVFRLNANGTLDKSFGTKGYSTVNIAKGFELNLTYRAAMGSDGSLYVVTSDDPAGYANNGVTGFFSTLTKLTPDGLVDESWGHHGAADIPLDLWSNPSDLYSRSIDSIIVRDDGSVLLAGTEDHLKAVKKNGSTSYELTARYTYVTRLRSNGRTDTAFGNQGELKFLNANVFRFDSAPVALVRSPEDESLILSFRSYGRQQFLDLSTGGKTYSKVRIDGVWEPYRDGFFSLYRLKDGRLIRTSLDGIAEVRKLSDGRWDTQPYRRPKNINGNVVEFPTKPLISRDGSLLTIGAPGPGGTNDPYMLLKLQPGDGTEVRDDFIPNAQQHALSLDSDNPDISTGTVSVFFYDAAKRSLGYRQRGVDGQWSKIEVIDASYNAGIYLSAVGSVVAYTDGGRGDLKFAWRGKTGKWQIETVDSVGSTGLYPSIVALPGGNGYAIAYYNRSKGDLRLARRDKSGHWTIETVDSVGDVGRIPKLIVKQHNNQLAIAYATDGDRSIRLAEAGVGSAPWTFQEVATTTGGVGKIDLDYDIFDWEFGPFSDAQLAAFVAYYDAGPADLVIARRPGLGQKFAAFRVASKGTVGLQPDVQQSGSAATLFFDRTNNRIRTAHVFAYPKISAQMGDDVIVADAGPYFSAINRNSRYDMVLAWYDSAKGGLQIRNAGWRQ